MSTSSNNATNTASQTTTNPNGGVTHVSSGPTFVTIHPHGSTTSQPSSHSLAAPQSRTLTFLPSDISPPHSRRVHSAVPIRLSQNRLSSDELPNRTERTLGTMSNNNIPNNLSSSSPLILFEWLDSIPPLFAQMQTTQPSLDRYVDTIADNRHMNQILSLLRQHNSIAETLIPSHLLSVSNMSSSQHVPSIQTMLNSPIGFIAPLIALADIVSQSDITSSDPAFAQTELDLLRLSNPQLYALIMDPNGPFANTASSTGISQEDIDAWFPMIQYKSHYLATHSNNISDQSNSQDSNPNVTCSASLVNSSNPTDAVQQSTAKDNVETNHDKKHSQHQQQLHDHTAPPTHTHDTNNDFPLLCFEDDSVCQTNQPNVTASKSLLQVGQDEELLQLLLEEPITSVVSTTVATSTATDTNNTHNTHTIIADTTTPLNQDTHSRVSSHDNATTQQTLSFHSDTPQQTSNQEKQSDTAQHSDRPSFDAVQVVTTSNASDNQTECILSNDHHTMLSADSTLDHSVSSKSSQATPQQQSKNHDAVQQQNASVLDEQPRAVENKPCSSCHDNKCTSNTTCADDNASKMTNVTAAKTTTLDNPTECCAICLEEFHWDDWVRVLSCGHVFHAKNNSTECCIDKWLREKASCPQCRARVVSRPVRSDTRSSQTLEAAAATTTTTTLAPVQALETSETTTNDSHPQESIHHSLDDQQQQQQQQPIANLLPHSTVSNDPSLFTTPRQDAWFEDDKHHAFSNHDIPLSDETIQPLSDESVVSTTNTCTQTMPTENPNHAIDLHHPLVTNQTHETLDPNKSAQRHTDAKSNSDISNISDTSSLVGPYFTINTANKTTNTTNTTHSMLYPRDCNKQENELPIHTDHVSATPLIRQEEEASYFSHNNETSLSSSNSMLKNDNHRPRSRFTSNPWVRQQHPHQQEEEATVSAAAPLFYTDQYMPSVTSHSFDVQQAASVENGHHNRARHSRFTMPISHIASNTSTFESLLRSHEPSHHNSTMSSIIHRDPTMMMTTNENQQWIQKRHEAYPNHSTTTSFFDQSVHPTMTRAIHDTSRDKFSSLSNTPVATAAADPRTHTVNTLNTVNTMHAMNNNNTKTSNPSIQPLQAPTTASSTFSQIPPARVQYPQNMSPVQSSCTASSQQHSPKQISFYQNHYTSLNQQPVPIQHQQHQQSLPVQQSFYQQVPYTMNDSFQFSTMPSQSLYTRRPVPSPQRLSLFNTNITNTSNNLPRTDNPSLAHSNPSTTAYHEHTGTRHVLRTLLNNPTLQQSADTRATSSINNALVNNPYHQTRFTMPVHSSMNQSQDPTNARTANHDYYHYASQPVGRSVSNTLAPQPASIFSSTSRHDAPQQSVLFRPFQSPMPTQPVNRSMFFLKK